MAGSNDQQSDRLEDQLRKMILNPADSVQSVQGNPRAPSQQPTVRLPPTGSYAQQQHPRVNTRTGHFNAPHQSRGANQSARSQNNFAQHPNGFPNHPANPHLAHQQRQSYGNVRPQQNGHFGRNFQHGNPNFNPAAGSPSAHVPSNQRSRRQQQMPLDPDAFRRGNLPQNHGTQRPGQPQLFNPSIQRPPQMQNLPGDHFHRQIQYVEHVAASEVASVEMSEAESAEKNAFRLALERKCQEVCEADPDRLPEISLECFGSFKSGFATAGSDMDLVIVVKDNSPSSACFSLLEDDLPRALEKRLLELGFGARLLSRTRVPIIKVCEKPSEEFLNKLREEREKWNVLPEAEKYPHLQPNQVEEPTKQADDVGEAPMATQKDPSTKPTETGQIPSVAAPTDSANGKSAPEPQEAKAIKSPTADSGVGGQQEKTKRDEKPWTRERKAGPLDFPKSGVGVQSDINFFNPLGLHNTQMLRCYTLCDPRVRPFVLFVKAWAKRRKINSSYSGTLSSYGYVLMALHYLMNVAQPPIIPNLQARWRPQGNFTPARPTGEEIEGWKVNFWHDENEITTAARQGKLSMNRESVSSLLVGFYQYYASQGGGLCFQWMREVLSLRTPGGTISKDDKGWVKAVTEEGEGKRIQHRYLFCIEDPFELSHNVARTVTHKGIVAIRDEFRRAKRILVAVGNGWKPKDGELFAQLVEAEDFEAATEEQKKNTNLSINNATPNDPRRGSAIDSATRGLASPPIKTTAPAPSKLAPSMHIGALSVNTTDDDSGFPALGSVHTHTKRKSQTGQNESWSEISGDKAKAVLDEVRRKRDEAQAESTAMGAAEAVLGDSD